MPPGTCVLSTEFKINLIAPARGERIIARGHVVKAGRTLTVAQSEVVAESGRQEKLIAILTATLTTVEARELSATNSRSGQDQPLTPQHNIRPGRPAKGGTSHWARSAWPSA
jgi:acyl-CoA hydrolase